MTMEFQGRHYETGAIANVLAAMGVSNLRTGKPYSEALALGASGGIAFGYFVFEYTGHLPHVALLTRNTFSPFERALDNLAIRREQRETVDGARAEKNLRLELDAGNIVLVWADVFSMPYRSLDPQQMWQMQPLVVLGHDGEDFLVADGALRDQRVSAGALAIARGRVKKDRYRMMTLEPPDADRLADGLRRGMETCAALFLDKPPAGSANNFGIAGMRHFAKMLRDPKNAKGWAKTFAPGPRFVQALAGRHGQPGVADWIERWGTADGADRGTYAAFLREAADWTGLSDLNEIAKAFDRSAPLWQDLAEAAMPDSIPAFRELKALKRRHARLWFEHGADSNDERAAIRREMGTLVERLGVEEELVAEAPAIRERMAELVERIAETEEPAVRDLRAAISP